MRRLIMLDASRPEKTYSTSPYPRFENGTGTQPLSIVCPSPIYATDAERPVTYGTRPASISPGREPQLGHDRWCVTWQLLHDKRRSPAPRRMPDGKAIQEKCAIRDASRHSAPPGRQPSSVQTVSHPHLR